jgi:hypothetical protein
MRPARQFLRWLETSFSANARTAEVDREVGRRLTLNYSDGGCRRRLHLTNESAVMDDPPLRDFFVKPSCPRQRQYEALRAVFVDGLSQKEAAGRFGYSYGAFRQLVLEFRSERAAGNAPPFSPEVATSDLPRQHRLPPRLALGNRPPLMPAS